MPLPDAPPFTYEPGRGFVVTGTTPGKIGSASPWTTSTGFNQVTEVGPFSGSQTSTSRTNDDTSRFSPTSDLGPFVGGTPSFSQTTKAVEETSRFLPTTQRTGLSSDQNESELGQDGTGLGSEQNGTGRGLGSSDQSGLGSEQSGTGIGSDTGLGSGGNRSDESGRNRAINVGQISDNSFVPPSGSSSLRPSTKVGIEMTDGQTTSLNGFIGSSDSDGQVSI